MAEFLPKPEHEGLVIQGNKRGADLMVECQCLEERFWGNEEGVLNSSHLEAFSTLSEGSSLEASSRSTKAEA